MCGRYELKVTLKELVNFVRHLSLEQRQMPAADEMRPMDSLLMLTSRVDGYVGSKARWGLVGNFLANEPRNPPINLRSEGLVDKPFYGKILQRNRCLIPATAFFEWSQVVGGGKQKMRFSHAKGKPLLFAGVFDQHRLAGTTCAILTTQANESVGRIHDRMPVILGPEQSAFWLDPYTEFPADEFDEVMRSSSQHALKIEAVTEPEISPQLAFVFT